MKKDLNKSTKIFWGIGDMGLQIMLSTKTAFFAIFLTDVVGFPVPIASSIMMISSVIDFFLAPFAGYIIQSFKPLPWGRIRSWLLVGPPFLALFFTLQFTAINNNWWGALFITLAYILAHTFLNLSYTATLSMVPVIASTKEQRIFLNSKLTMGGNIGKIINSTFVPAIIAWYSVRYASEKMIYFLIALATSLLMVLGFLCHFKMASGYEKNEESEFKRSFGLKDAYITVKGNKPLLGVLISDLASNTGSWLLPAITVYYYRYVSAQPQLLGVHLILCNLAALGGAAIIGNIRRNFNRKRIIIVVYVIISSLLFTSWFFAYQTYIFLILHVLVQVFVGMTQPLEAELYMDTAIYGNWKSGKDTSSFVIGLMNIPNKLAVILNSVILSVTFVAVGYVAGAPSTPGMQQGIINAYVIVPGIIPLIGVAALLILYTLTPKSIEKMKDETMVSNQK